RNLISEKLERGKISIAIEYQPYGEKEIKQSYNEALFSVYYAQLKTLAESVGASSENLFEIALNSPDVIQNKLTEVISETEWIKIKDSIQEAINKCNNFRLAEGSVLDKMLRGCIEVISTELDKVSMLDPKRIQKI